MRLPVACGEPHNAVSPNTTVVCTGFAPASGFPTRRGHPQSCTCRGENPLNLLPMVYECTRSCDSELVPFKGHMWFIVEGKLEFATAALGFYMW
jgi:hypothetical protein